MCQIGDTIAGHEYWARNRRHRRKAIPSAFARVWPFTLGAIGCFGGVLRLISWILQWLTRRTTFAFLTVQLSWRECAS